MQEREGMMGALLIPGLIFFPYCAFRYYFLKKNKEFKDWFFGFGLIYFWIMNIWIWYDIYKWYH